MPRDVDISVGSETSAAAAGFAELKNYAAKARTDLQHEFAQAIAFTGLIAGIEQVIDKAHEIHHQAERFGVDSQFLQIMANAAKEDGVQLNSVARAMNLLEINTQKARDGSDKITNAFGVLGIKIEDVRTLRPEELMLRIADGVKNASDRTAAYAAVATLLGARMGTDLIPVLEKGSAAILQIGTDMGVMSDETIKKLDKTHKQLEVFKQQLTVGLGGAVSWLITHFQEFVDTVTEMIIAFVAGGTAAFSSLNKAIHLDFAGAKKEWADFFQYVSDLQDAHTREAQIDAEEKAKTHPPSAEGTGHIGFDASEANPGDVGVGSSGGGGGKKADAAGKAAAESIAALRERAAKLQEESFHRQETLEEKLNSLNRERAKVQDDMLAQAVTGTQTEEDYYKAEIAIAEKDKEIDATKQSIAKEAAEAAKQAAAYAVEQSKIREEVEKEALAQDRRLQLLQLELNGHGDLVEDLRKGWEYEDKINDLAQRISDAYRDGDETLGDQLTKMQEQVKEEEKLATAAKKVREEMERQNKLAADFNDERSQISGDQQEQLRKQGKSEQEIAALGGKGTGIATLGSAVGYTDYNLLRATRPDGTVDQDLYRRLNAAEQVKYLNWMASGSQQNPPGNIGFAEAASLNAKAAAFARSQEIKDQQDARTRYAVQATYYSQVASGRDMGLSFQDWLARFEPPYIQKLFGILDQIATRLNSNPGQH